ncbi:MAG: glycerate kinase [Cyanophyceae cyanobacterium]
MPSSAEVVQILQHLGRFSPEARARLVDYELADVSRAQAFGITEANVQPVVTARTQLFERVAARVLALCHHYGISDSAQILVTLWRVWLPLAMQLQSVKPAGQPLIQGILGGQGTGKTTLAAVCRLILEYLGLTTLCVSIDDLYKTYAERQQLQRQDPRLIWRGPPGTHDLELGMALLKQCRQPQRGTIIVPRFDKSAFAGAGDRTQPEVVDSADIVLFEGWFVGVRPVETAVFEQAPPPITTPADRQFARNSNERLKEYLPLWEQLDRLMVLYPIDYRLSKQWRREAEQKMKASGKPGMSDTEVEQFVEYFWRSLHPELLITPLVKRPDLVDLVIEVQGDRSIGQVYRP